MIWVIKQEVSFYIDSALLEEFKILCVRRRKRSSHLVTEGMKLVLEKYQKEKPDS